LELGPQTVLPASGTTPQPTNASPDSSGKAHETSRASTAGPTASPRKADAVRVRSVAANDELATMLAAMGQLYVNGATPDFAAVDRPWPRQKLSLPTYPFQRSRYWITEVAQYVGK
jgi:acyl transferase domain-containing protein